MILMYRKENCLSLSLILAVSFLITGITCQECRKCDKKLRKLVALASTVLERVDPIIVNNSGMCVKLTLAGISSLQHNNVSCISQNPDNCFSQMIELSVKSFNMSCLVSSSTLGSLFPGILKKIPGVSSMASRVFGFVGNVIDAVFIPNFHVRAVWEDMVFFIKTNLCFDTKNYTVTDFQIKPRTVDQRGLRVWCEGGSMVGRVCRIVSQADFVSRTVGRVISYMVRQLQLSSVKDPSVKGYLTALNCGNGVKKKKRKHGHSIL